MMMPTLVSRIARSAFVLSAAVYPIQSQPGWLITDNQAPTYSRLPALMKEEAKVRVTLKLDRSTYLAGETATVSITVENTGTSAVEIRNPFHDTGATFDLLSLNGKLYPVFSPNWPSLSPHPRHEYKKWDPNPPTVFLAAGHRLEREFRGHEQLDGERPGSSIILMVPSFPGTFRFYYHYGPKPTVDFKVIQPMVEAHTTIFMQKTEPRVSERDQHTYQMRRFVHIVALGGDGGHWLCAPVGVRSGETRLLIDSSGFLPSYEIDNHLQPFIRVARSDTPIVSITGSADAAENLTIIWKNQAGQMSTISLDRNRKPIVK